MVERAQLSRLPANEGRRRVADAIAGVESVLHGHPKAVRMVLAAVLARGHVLVEDVPGVGKTILARAVARLLGNELSRIQFTADMLPSDVLGVQVLKDGSFELKRGPIFAQVVLADEINRASPKTQSAMLEAMGEGSVTIDDQTYILPQPFVVIATQNPVEHHGAYPLPESQLDRFAVGLSLGYPGKDVERQLVLAPDVPLRNLGSLTAVLEPRTLLELQKYVDQVEIGADVADYLLSITEATRQHRDVLLGCSPRGSVVFAAVARARAFIEGRDFVVPDDVKAVAAAVLAHRIAVGSMVSLTRDAARNVISEILAELPVPR